ncbi:MAG: hypothetical protein Q8905_08805, partial [Bacteroidota bacterium]|nr:hypothetical protein [Bacteroidota bacterium]
QYSGKTLPVFTVRTEKEAGSKPFVVVFEPYRGENAYTIDHISLAGRNDGKDFTSLKVFLKDNSSQMIFQSVDNSKTFSDNLWKFRGYFGIVGLTGNKVSSLYLGKGKELSYGDYSVYPEAEGAVNLIIDRKTIRVSCNQPTRISVASANITKVILHEGSSQTILPVKKVGKRVFFSVPEVENAEVEIQ